MQPPADCPSILNHLRLLKITPAVFIEAGGKHLSGDVSLTVARDDIFIGEPRVGLEEPRDFTTHGPSHACAPFQRREPKQRSEEHTSELQSQSNLVCRLLLE